MANDVGTLAITLTANAAGLSRGFNQAIGMVERFGALAGVVVGGGLAVGMAALGRSAVSAGMDYESAAASFEVMTGSAAEGKRLLDSLGKLAIDSPFQSTELIANAQKLKAVGTETEQIIPTLKALGDLSMGDSEKLGRLTKAFTDVKNNGRATAEELNQFAETGVPIIQGLADAMGKPKEAIRGLAEQGKVSFPVVVAAINKMTQAGGTFFGMMDRQSDTARGQLNALTENLGVASRNAGLAFIKGFGLTDLLRQFSETTEGIGRMAERLEPFFRRAREGFDVMRAGASALAEVVGIRLVAAMEEASGAKLDWSDMKAVGVAAVEALITAFGTLTEVIVAAGRKLSANLIDPLAKALKAFGPQAPAKPPGWADYGKAAVEFGSLMPRVMSWDFGSGPLLGLFGKDPLNNGVEQGGLFDSTGKVFAQWANTAAQEAESPEMKAARDAAGRMGDGLGKLAESLRGADSMTGFTRQWLEKFRGNLAGMNKGGMGSYAVLAKLAGDTLATNNRNTALGGAVGGIAGLGAGGGIRAGNALSKDAVDFAAGLQKRLGEGSPLGKFNRTRDLIQESLAGGLITAGEAARGLGEAFVELDGAARDISQKIAPAAERNTVEAQRAINAAMASGDRGDIQQRIFEVEKRAADIAARQEQELKRIGDLLGGSRPVGRTF